MPERVRLFGSATLRDRDEWRPLPADRRGCLLAYLASDGGWVDRDRLALLFWPESGEDSAKRNLRQLLLRTKRLDPDPDLEARSDAVRWHVDSDIGQFRRALAVGDHARAVALYRGPFLDGFALDGMAAAGAWLESERERLHAAFHGAAMRESSALVERGELTIALELLAGLYGYDEFAEDVAAAYIRALGLAGRREAAIEVYLRFAAVLREDLGLEPLEETRALIEAVKRGQALAAPAPGTAPAHSPLPGPLRSPRLVGREAERQALRTAATPLVVVSGAPGVGKSRLLREVLPQASYCGASEGLEQVPYHPLSKLVREHSAAAAGLGAYVEDLARLVPEIAPDLSPSPLEADLAKGRLAEAIARFVTAIGTPLLVDDLQWADPATLETLVYLTDRGVAVVGASRSSVSTAALDEFLASYAERGELTRVELSDLGEADVRDLLADLMAIDSGPPAFAAWLWQRSSGNPMFLLESLKALFESGALWAEGDRWHTDVDDLTRDYTELDVPPLVSEVILRRLGNLSREAQRTIMSAAVTQLADDHRFLADVTGLSIAGVADALDEGSRAGFLTDGGFQHDLLRQSVYASVEPHRKRMLHTLAGDHLVEKGRPELAAEHLWQAGETSRAREAWTQHVWTLRTRGLLVDATAVLRHAIARLPSGEDATWLRLQLVDTLRESDHLDDALRELEELELPVGASASLRFRQVQAAVALRLQTGAVAEARELLRASRGLAALVDDEELLVDDAMFMARVAREEQRTAEAIEYVAPLVARMRQKRPDVRLVQFLTSLAVLNDDDGRFDAALALHTEALDLARALGSRYFQVETVNNMVVCLESLGRYDEAVALAEETLTLGEYDNAPTLRINLASTYLTGGRAADALRHYRQLLDRHEPHLRLIALARCVECLAVLGAADPSGAKASSDLDSSALIDAAVVEVQSTDFPPAVARAVIATLKHGDEQQRRRLLDLELDLSLEQYPSYLRDELTEALAVAGG